MTEGGRKERGEKVSWGDTPIPPQEASCTSGDCHAAPELNSGLRLHRNNRRGGRSDRRKGRNDDSYSLDSHLRGNDKRGRGNNRRGSGNNRAGCRNVRRVNRNDRKRVQREGGKVSWGIPPDPLQEVSCTSVSGVSTYITYAFLF